MEGGEKIMSTVIRAELSKSNKYYIDKHRYYELKHFCLQYPVWKKTYLALGNSYISPAEMRVGRGSDISDYTGRDGLLRAYYREKMDLIEETAADTDIYLKDYILKAVTEGLSYPYLQTKLQIPCSRDMYYDRYRKFFWLLNDSRD